MADLVPNNIESHAVILVMIIVSVLMFGMFSSLQELTPGDKKSFMVSVNSNHPELVPNFTLDCTSAPILVRGEEGIECSYNASQVSEMNELTLHRIDGEVLEVEWLNQTDLGRYQGLNDASIDTSDLAHGNGSLDLEAPWQTGRMILDIDVYDDFEEELQNRTGTEDLFLRIRSDYDYPGKEFTIYSHSRVQAKNQAILTLGFNLFALFSLIFGGFGLIYQIRDNEPQSESLLNKDRVGVLLLYILLAALVSNLVVVSGILW